MNIIEALKVNDAMCNTAYQLSQLGEEMDRINREKRQKEQRQEQAILKTAEFTEQQKILLEQQLQTLKDQNEQLQQNNKLLNELYNNAKQDAKESAKDAKKNRVFGWVSFAVGTFIGIAGVILGIIF